MMQGLSRKTRHAVRRARRRRAAMMNIVPMIDILTVLVFFLLMNSAGVSILGINLPSANAQPPEHPRDQLTVTLHTDNLLVADNNGAIRRIPRLADGHYDLHGLGQLLEQIKQRMPDQTGIVLLLEPDTPYDALVAVMDTVRAQPEAQGSGTVQLFPDISLGDAGPEAATPPAGAATPPTGGSAP